MSFLKYQHERQSGNQFLHWHRAEIDGAPYRGPQQAPLLKEQEYDALAEQVWDVHVRQLNMLNPEDVAEYAKILEGMKNSWYQILHVDRRYVDALQTWLIHIEYSIPHMELPAANLNRLSSQILPR